MNILRQSALNSWEMCPRMFYEQWGAYGSETEYEDNDETRQNKYSLTGIKFHEVMEEWGRRKMEGSNKMRLKEMHEMLDVKLKEIDSCYYDTPDEELRFRDSLHEQLDWIFDIVWEMKPIAVEHNFQAPELFAGMPPFSGTIDLVIGDERNRSVTLMDWKTGRVYTKNELKSNMQACIYAEYWHKQYGYYPEEFVFYFTKHKKRKTIQITPEFMQNGEERIRGIWMHILNEDFKEPNKPNKWFCVNMCSSTTCKHKNNKWSKVGWGTLKPPV